ncbi:MAG: glutamate-1-semialdehyde 2,1-aminomutase [Sphingobacteriales bacterium]|jgi:glutamate-1-semialdehyde 2,1-aminomutase
MTIAQSQTLFQRANQSIPGGVNSPVRAFRSVGGTPIFMDKAEGAYLYDADGNQYIDFINSWGPMIMGHGFAPVVEAIRKRAAEAISFGAPTEMEIRMAELVKKMAPNVDLIRMVNSGTEACMSAIRLARGYTGRNKIIKFEGCYHGHADSFLVKAGSGVATLNIDQVPGVTPGVVNDSFTAPFNNLDAVWELVAQHPEQFAAIIVEPVAGNMGCILPQPGFLEGLRKLCDEEGIVFIFDEVMTGFRLAPGGAQERLTIDADLITYGKVIGGGMPVGAFGGKRAIMEHIAPLGKVYQAGTLSGNPIAMAAGYALLSYLHDHPEIYIQLEVTGNALAKGIDEVMQRKTVPYVINQCGSMISVHFSDQPVIDFSTAAAARNDVFNKLFHHMLDRGVYMPPSAYETWFISHAIGQKEIDVTLEALDAFQA